MNNAELVIVGDGEELNHLKKLSEGFSNIIFKGYLKHEQTIEEMKQSDIFILTSENETFGMVYLEAMGAGCITVGLAGDGIDGILKNKQNGYLCNLTNVQTTLEAIINSENQSYILENSFKTIQNYTNISACLNYSKYF